MLRQWQSQLAMADVLMLSSLVNIEKSEKLLAEGTDSMSGAVL